MTSKDEALTRPLGQRRTSAASAANHAVSSRNPTSRRHSQSLLQGSFNPNHRVSRRRSAHATSNNTAEVRAFLADPHTFQANNFNAQGQDPTGVTMGTSERSHEQNHDVFQIQQPSFSDHYPALPVAEASAPTGSASKTSKSRGRRPSEALHLVKNEGKRLSAKMTCEECGKGYTHFGSYLKHSYEHKPEWKEVSAVKASKHEQVLMFKAAQSLVNISKSDTVEAGLSKPTESGQSSASPNFSVSSGVRDDVFDEYSSAETTPPPTSEQYSAPVGISTGRSKRYSGMSSSYSRSYQSVPTGFSSANNSFSQRGSYSRPSTSGYAEGINEGDHEELAAGVSSLMRLGTPNTGPVLLRDAPPVPPLPARYAEEHQRTRSGKLMAQADFGLPSPSYLPLSNERGTPMPNNPAISHGHDRQHGQTNPAYSMIDEEEGVFGSMEGLAHENHHELSNAGGHHRK